MSEPQYRVLGWDSEWFGIPIGRAEVPEITDASAAEMDAWARTQGLKCVYVFTGIAARSAAPPAGFKLMDKRVEYELDPLVLAKEPSDAADTMRPEEQGEVCELARQLFNDTRFSRDTRFPPARVKELYAEWVRQDSKGGRPGCLVVRHNGTVSGFITGRTDPADPARGSIGLLGVADSQRGLGLGRNLLDHVCRVFVESGVKRVTVVTQASNTAACHLYEGGGHIVASGYWYHRWYD